VARSIDIKRKVGTKELLASESAVLEMVARGRPLSEVLEALTRLLEVYRRYHPCGGAKFLRSAPLAA
jgi:hypothetical protein